MSTMNTAGEKAMALVDGQLAPAEVPGLVQELARNAPLVAELQAYLAMSQSRIGAVFAAKGEETVPPRLVDTVMRTPIPRPTRPSAFAGALHRVQKSYRVPAWSLAAGPALAACAALALYVMAWPAGRTGGVAEADLAPALERTLSGKDAVLASVRPVLSFTSKTAGWCRQFEVRYANRQVSHALACRGDDGRWNLLASTPPGADGFTPASADRRKAIDDLASSMMRGEPLSQADEAALIGKGWRRL